MTHSGFQLNEVRANDRAGPARFVAFELGGGPDTVLSLKAWVLSNVSGGKVRVGLLADRQLETAAAAVK